MSYNPLVSIALCTYNGEKYLAQQLDTLIAQTYPNIEIVAVDDCSTDDTYNILSEYSARYPQITVYKNEGNLGYVKNFERALTLCKGELIALCDQDDLWNPEKIALQVDAIKDNTLVYHDSEFINEDGTPMGKKMSDVVNPYRGDEPEVFLFFNCVSGHAILMKRELLADALPLKRDYFHDWWLAYVATNIGRIDYLPQCLVQYRQHDKSDTNILGIKRKKDKYKFSSYIKLQRAQTWLKYCVDFPKNRDQLFIEKVYNSFSLRMNSYISFEFATMLFKHRKTMLKIRKKSNASNLNYIYKQIWGVLAKKAIDKP